LNDTSKGHFVKSINGKQQGLKRTHQKCHNNLKEHILCIWLQTNGY
jgi:hypothetical protein